MPKEYICELCGKDFSQKIDWERHKAMKKSCLPAEKVVELLKKTQDQEQIKKAPEQVDNKSQLITFFKSILNFLRDNAHLTGDKALKTIAYVSILRLSEAQIDVGAIDIESNDYYDFDAYEEETINQFKTALRFSVLENRDKMGMVQTVKHLREVILCRHPKFKDFFNRNDDPFRIKSDATFKELLTRFKNFPFESFDHDILGEAYEEVIKDIMVGKVLGQFFTPPALKQFMVELIDPQIKKDGTFETIYDPALGTAGFLLTALRYLTKKAKDKNIKLNEKFLTTKGLGGREAEDDTFRLAKANMLISAGHMFDTIDCDDSIRNPIKGKYDIVLANPPFGIKGLNYKLIPNDYDIKKFDYLPIMSNSAIPLFLQAIIYMLKVNGRAAIVVPNGQDLFNKSNDLVALREFIMKTCDLKEIIYMPADIFNNTGVKTCVFYFEKKKEGKNVLTVKYSKDNSKVISYDFVEEHQTKSVNFYDYDMITQEKKLLVDVPIEKIAENSYSLNYSDYMEKVDKKYENTIQVKSLGDICVIENGKRIVKDQTETGEYPVYGSGDITFYTNNYNRDGITCKIGRFALSKHNCIQIINGKYYLNDSGFTIKSNDETQVNSKYIWYYLLQNKQKIYECSRGTAQINIDMETFKQIQIPIPSLETQKQIVEQLDLLSENNGTNEKCIEEFKKIMKCYVETYTMKGEMKQLKDICKIKYGGSKYSNEEGEYPLYGGGINYIKLIKDFNVEKNTITIPRSGNSAGFVNITFKKSYIANFGYYIDDLLEVNSKYLYYNLKSIENKLMSLPRGTAQPNLGRTDLENVQINIVSKDKQNEIVTYCDDLSNMIQQLGNQIKSNNGLMKQILENYLQTKNETVDVEIDDNIIEADVDNDEKQDEPIEQEKVTEKKKDLVVVKPKAKQQMRSNLDRQIKMYDQFGQKQQSEPCTDLEEQESNEPVESITQEVIEEPEVAEQFQEPKPKIVKKVIMKKVVKVVAKKKVPAINSSFP
ncbi:MAG: type I restriction-modification DNA methylase [Terrestrivirus sp.]|uniref:site-specific DNA-methyltransferase (adenine-specific) n=1 Tax=Terrestrivirus sp. TaxID=2487775 RepID=A0A3G4ZNV7_9VIRU|nr:MAG: type I restriction-modification DNA methylase [Terrestrivirus sp.]